MEGLGKPKRKGRESSKREWEPLRGSQKGVGFSEMERWSWKGAGISGSSKNGMKGTKKEWEPQGDPNLNRDPGEGGC